jgi:hypothetical protein
MNARKFWTAALATISLLAILLLAPACDGAETPPVRPETSPPPPTDATPPVITARQELEEQLDMLRALAEAEKGRGKDVSQAEAWLEEADQALQADDLILAREKLRQAGQSLGVRLP